MIRIRPFKKNEFEFLCFYLFLRFSNYEPMGTKQLFYCFISCLCIIGTKQIAAQCPYNIGFEDGTFNGWQCYSGTITSTGSVDNLKPTPPLADRHVMLMNSVPQEKDFYGKFPVNCPNGSKYSIRLGNSATGAQAERVSYTFTIPAWQNDFSIIYNYAVVFQNPNHSAVQQPKFTARVFDVGAQDYVGCGSFEFVASSGLPGFEVSTVKTDVFFKPWSPITLKLNGYAGKTIRLEFTNNDCSPGGHFGYAYIDVNENCESPISGNTYCAGMADSLTLVAPYGFQAYNWYTADFSTLLGTSNTLTLSPPPPPNTVYALEIIPYPGLGCLDTLTTKIEYSGAPFSLKVKDTVASCSSSGADLTQPLITAGSSAGMMFSYYNDITQQEYLPTPSYVTTAGTYYIKGKNIDGCNGIKPVTVVLQPGPTMVVQPTATVCSPQKVDLTNPSYIAGSDAGLIYSYWGDLLATLPVAVPNAIDASGSYFIKGTDAAGCFNVQPLAVNISTTPSITTTDQVGCGKVSLNDPGTFSASNLAIISYWSDLAATVPLPTEILTATGTYYIKAGNADGCNVVRPINIIIKPVPSFSLNNPPPIAFPIVMDLASLVSPIQGSAYSYWLDAMATKPLLAFHSIDTTGTYYIKALNTEGCSLTLPVKVVVNEPDIIPPNAISPNGDGINDTWEIPLLRRYRYCNVEIFNRYGQLLFSTIGYSKPWDGKVGGKILPNGTYYYIINRGPGFQPLSGNISIVK
jgi:gliding motility-associated-like protein